VVAFPILKKNLMLGYQGVERIASVPDTRELQLAGHQDTRGVKNTWYPGYQVLTL